MTKFKPGDLLVLNKFVLGTASRATLWKWNFSRDRQTIVTAEPAGEITDKEVCLVLSARRDDYLYVISSNGVMGWKLHSYFMEVHQ